MEVAVRTPGDYLMELLGLTYEVDWFELVVRAALALPLPPGPRRPVRYAASYLPSASPGTVTEVSGLDEVAAHDCVVDAAVSVAPEDVVTATRSVRGARRPRGAVRVYVRPSLRARSALFVVRRGMSWSAPAWRARPCPRTDQLLDHELVPRVGSSAKDPGSARTDRHRLPDPGQGSTSSRAPSSATADRVLEAEYRQPGASSDSEHPRRSCPRSPRDLRRLAVLQPPPRGLPEAPQAVVVDSTGKGIRFRSEDDVYLGNGVSDLILMSLQAVVDPGDEVLVPAPDYPLWTAGGPHRRRTGRALPVRRVGELAPRPGGRSRGSPTGPRRWWLSARTTPPVRSTRRSCCTPSSTCAGDTT